MTRDATRTRFLLANDRCHSTMWVSLRERKKESGYCTGCTPYKNLGSRELAEVEFGRAINSNSNDAALLL
ncbi:hypothetical protein L596_003806 [Steinernema carpocapsae]|uniref:Uncharacterized protein n=1 Tax=Steinernema carpocapsae TaxID=34508 RepID=A0A4U8UXT4_STECR|nr:hypothetical protein L596_003806 [Steinernema carpocapsae]